MDKITLKVQRYSKEKGFWFQNYDVERQKGMTVLGALIHIHDNVDSTLALDYNCRAGRCGTCGVMVNGNPVLACETQLPEKREVLIAPKRSQALVRDLFSVDREMWKIRKELLASHPFSPAGEPPYRIDPSQLQRFNVLDSCIECGLCQSACPNIANGWIGPMHAVYAAKLDAHPIDTLDRSGLLMGNGMGACDTNFSCQRSCPKGITITQDAIIPEKERRVSSSLKKIFSALKGRR